MRHHAALLLVVALTTALSAQDYRVEVRLVEIEVRVTDRRGVPITDLSRADFSLKEDGVPHDVAGVQFVPHGLADQTPPGAGRRPAPRRHRRKRRPADTHVALHRDGRRGSGRIEDGGSDPGVPGQRRATRIQGVARRPRFHRGSRAAVGDAGPAWHAIRWERKAGRAWSTSRRRSSMMSPEIVRMPRHCGVRKTASRRSRGSPPARPGSSSRAIASRSR